MFHFWVLTARFSAQEYDKDKFSHKCERGTCVVLDD